MRTPQQLVHSRARTNRRYALFPLEGYPTSRLPTWNAAVRILAAPALGAGFAQYLIDVAGSDSGYFPADPAVETFYYVLSGGGHVVDGIQAIVPVTAGSFGLFPPGSKPEFVSVSGLSLLCLRKSYEPYDAIPIGKDPGRPRADVFAPLHSHESAVPPAVWGDNPHTLLQTLIPDQLQFDLAMNIFSFDPGFGLPYVETHVMEHGALILQGKGLYYLDGDWMEVEKDDYIWMGPFCPQSFYATGPVPAKYIYYKNVNRDIEL